MDCSPTDNYIEDQRNHRLSTCLLSFIDFVLFVCVYMCVYACIYFKQHAQMHCVLILVKQATTTKGPYAGGLVLSTLSMTKVTLGHTFCEQILSKRAVILQAIPEHVRYVLTLVYVYEHLRKDV